MKRAVLAALASLAFFRAALASANLDCSAKGKAVAKFEVEAGKAIEFACQAG